MSSIVEGLIDEYVEDFYRGSEQAEELKAIMKVYEPFFEEWNNDDNGVYEELQITPV